MKTEEFNFDLPQHLIAQFPAQQRGMSRLMTLDRITGEIQHFKCIDLPQILCDSQFLNEKNEKPLLVFNDTKVRKARLIGASLDSGKPAEFLLLEKINLEDNSHLWKAITNRMKKKKIGGIFIFYDNKGNEKARAKIIKTENNLVILEFDKDIDDAWLSNYGHIPLPPYIKRKDNLEDEDRYQTIYARQIGSSAAPTAGLHFTKELIEQLNIAGMEIVYITLHVGLGTFLPVHSENIEDHVMHNETYFIDDKSADKIEDAKKSGRKIIAVGTTSVRTLESAWENGKLKRGIGNTSIFIYPGYNFKVIDALFTNFHTPHSTLLMMACAFAGKEKIISAYKIAIENEYRFFSYGDAMLIS